MLIFFHVIIILDEVEEAITIKLEGCTKLSTCIFINTVWLLILSPVYVLVDIYCSYHGTYRSH